jgi:putative hydrolase of the HAD superfamily
MYGIIFDMDDTLYKERHYRDSGLRTVAQHFAAVCKRTPEDLFVTMRDNRAQAFEIVELLAARNNVKVSVADQLAIYRSHLPNISLDPVAEKVLKALRARGHKLGVITDGRAWGQLNKIASLKLDQYIDQEYIMATELTNTDKHSTKPFIDMMQLMGKTDGFVYIGDNPEKDFMHPNVMGWRTIMLRDIHDENIHRQELMKYPPQNRPQTVIESLEVLLDIYK